MKSKNDWDSDMEEESDEDFSVRETKTKKKPAAGKKNIKSKPALAKVNRTSEENCPEPTH